MLCIGHRGAKGHAPENTLLSVRRALELGADGIEVDVYVSHGQLLVFHDRRLERTTNGHGRLSRKSFEYLRSLDAGEGERIPTLQEVIDLVDHRAFLNIELKGANTAELVRAVIEDCVNRLGWSYEDFIVSSFRHRELRKLAHTRIRLGIFRGRSPRRLSRIAEAFGATSVHTSLRSAKPRFVAKAHQHGLKVFVYTVNDPADIARMEVAGVDGVFTDFPERVP